MIPISAMQIAALRALANGSNGLEFHAATSNGLLRRRLIELYVDGWRLTEAGRAEVAKLPELHTDPQPVTRMGAIQEVVAEREEESMVPTPMPSSVDAMLLEVCCDEFDAAIQYHVIARSKTVTLTYIGYPGRYWSISFCPFCGAKR
jgi:hypothetical protein